MPQDSTPAQNPTPIADRAPDAPQGHPGAKAGPSGGTIPIRMLVLLTGLPENTIRSLASRGYFPPASKGFFQTQETLAGIFRYFREQVSDPSAKGQQAILKVKLEREQTELELARAKLEALRPKTTPAGSVLTPGGYIRPGQKRPFRKATQEEIDRRIEEVIDLLGKQATKFQIHDYMQETYGVHWRSSDVLYIPRARKRMMEREQISRGELRSQAFALYQGFLKRHNQEPGIALAAQKAIREMFALDDPATQKLEHSGPGGKPMQSETIIANLPNDKLEALIEALTQGKEPKQISNSK